MLVINKIMNYHKMFRNWIINIVKLNYIYNHLSSVVILLLLIIKNETIFLRLERKWWEWQKLIDFDFMVSGTFYIVPLCEFTLIYCFLPVYTDHTKELQKVKGTKVQVEIFFQQWDSVHFSLIRRPYYRKENVQHE